jgi:hypothetical protein
LLKNRKRGGFPLNLKEYHDLPSSAPETQTFDCRV